MVNIANVKHLEGAKLVLIRASCLRAEVSDFVVLKSAKFDTFKVLEGLSRWGSVNPLRIYHILRSTVSVYSFSSSSCLSVTISIGIGFNSSFVVVVLNVENNPHTSFLHLVYIIFNKSKRKRMFGVFEGL